MTHAVGVVVLGVAALTSSSFSPEHTFKWAGVVSGLLVVLVGMGLFRDRLRTYRARRPLPRAVHTHDDHGHGHRVAIRHRVPQWRSRRLDAARNDPNFVVTNHAHGGAGHTHVLPAPGAKVSRRQLVSMGFAGGLVPSLSALVVLLGAIALERLWFGVILVVAYGIGLALTLVGAGLLLVYFEGKLKTWSAGSARGASSRRYSAPCRLRPPSPLSAAAPSSSPGP